MKTTDRKCLAPKWLLEREGITQRQWRARKRKELKQAVKAFGVYRLGGAYCPGINGEIGRIMNDFDALLKAHSAKEWK